MNSIKLQLNLEALSALFPEGSEARLDLQRNVVANMLERLALKDAKLMVEGFEGQAKKIADEALKSMGIAANWAGNFQLADRVQVVIREEVQKQVRTLVSNEIATAQHAARIDLEERVVGHVDAVVQNKVRHGLKDMIKDQIRDVLKGV